jgi:hypothetical protein
MSYKVTFRDRSEIILPDEAGLALKDHWLSLKKPENIEIGGDGYLSSQIVSIAKTNLAAAIVIGQRCRRGHSTTVRSSRFRKRFTGAPCNIATPGQSWS